MPTCAIDGREVPCSTPEMLSGPAPRPCGVPARLRTPGPGVCLDAGARSFGAGAVAEACPTEGVSLRSPA